MGETKEVGTHPSEEKITKFQAIFRGHRARKLHLDRVKQNLAWSPFVGSKESAIRDALQLAQVSSNDVVLDLGSGDGRILMVAVTEFNAASGIGFEIDPVLVSESRRKIQSEQLEDQIEILENDWTQDKPHVLSAFQQATVVFLFFLPHESIASMLQTRLRPGTRVLTNVYGIKEWIPIETLSTVPFLTTHGTSELNLYKV